MNDPEKATHLPCGCIDVPGVGLGVLDSCTEHEAHSHVPTNEPSTEGLGFHAKEGWFFKRIGEGVVLITLDGDEMGAQVAIDGNTWASIAASVSARGETAVSWREARDFHDVTREAAPESGSLEEWLLEYGPKPLREGGASSLLAKAREIDAEITTLVGALTEARAENGKWENAAGIYEAKWIAAVSALRDVMAPYDGDDARDRYKAAFTHAQSILKDAPKE